MAGLPAPEDYGPEWHRRETLAYRNAAAVLTFSERTARSMTRDYGVPQDRVHVVGAGANVFPKSVERADDGRTITFVGKDFERKGGRILLDAFSLVKQAIPDASLLIAGPPPRHGSGPGVQWVGELSYHAVSTLLSRSTLFCMPTLREPFGIAFIDAMACGVPCVGTSIEAVPEIVVDGVTGALVPPNDVRTLACTLEALLSDPQRSKRMGQAAREAVGSRFRWQLVANRIEQFLADIVEVPSRARELA